MHIEKNIGTLERIIRLFISLTILYLVFYKIVKGWWAFWGIIFAATEMLTVMLGYCFMYDILNWSPSKKISKNNQSESNINKEEMYENM